MYILWMIVCADIACILLRVVYECTLKFNFCLQIFIEYVRLCDAHKYKQDSDHIVSDDIRYNIRVYTTDTVIVGQYAHCCCFYFIH